MGVDLLISEDGEEGSEQLRDEVCELFDGFLILDLFYKVNESPQTHVYFKAFAPKRVIKDDGGYIDNYSTIDSSWLSQTLGYRCRKI